MPSSSPTQSAPAQAREYAQTMQALVAMRQEAQALRFKQQWEKRVVDTLTAAAEECHTLLRQALQEYPRLPQAPANHLSLRLTLRGACAAIAQDKCAQAKAILQDMARQEAQTLVGIITLHGLVGPRVSMENQTQGLAAGEALQRACDDAQEGFLHHLDKVLSQADTPQEGQPSLKQALRSLAWFYRRSLRTIAVTTTHAVANRIRQAVPLALEN